MPPPRNDNAQGQLSPDLAELLSQKIREMEMMSASQTGKKAQDDKDRAKTASKAKLKAAKKLVADTDRPCDEKVQELWSKFQVEHEQARSLESEADDRLASLGDAEQERRAKQAELSHAQTIRNKLESLCHRLQQRADLLMEERQRLTDVEKRRRHELADEYQRTIEDVKKKMDQQANERTRLARENEELRSSFKKFFDRYDGREKELLDEQKTRESEVASLNKQLQEQSEIYKEAAKREAVASRDNEDLLKVETLLRSQLQTYSNKFNNFQDALSKSDKVLNQYKRQKSKLQRKVEVLEKENQDLRARNEKKASGVQRDVQTLRTERDDLQTRCKALQAERQKLMEEVAKEGA